MAAPTGLSIDPELSNACRWDTRRVPVVVLEHRDRVMARRIRELQRASYAVEAELIGFNQMPPLVEEVEDVTNLTP